MEKTKQEQLAERKKRVEDAIALRVPDRVPIWFQDAGFFPAKYTGITCKDAVYDGDKLFAAYKKTFLDFEPDLYFNPGHAIHTPGGALDTLDCKMVLLPGQQNLPEDHSFQFVEGDYMKADEYDAFINDPTGYTISTYLPRVFGTLTPLGTLPPLTGMLLGYFGVPLTGAMVSDDIVTAMEKFCKAARLVQAHGAKAAKFISDMEDEGFPLSCGAITLAPFDLLGDTMRGLREILMDMFRRPDKLLLAIDKVTQLTIDLAVGQCHASGNKGVFIPLHKGSDGFLSDEQFKTFYWPSLKKLILALIDAGLTPCPFFEGIHDSRLEYYAELPKAKVLGLFDSTDYRKAKEIIGGTMCMSGFMPLTLLQTGTVDEVKAYAKDLIDVAGKDGGYIMGPKGVVDEAKPELIKAWFDFTKEYGRYS